MTIPVILSTGSLFNFDLDTAMALAGEIGFDNQVKKNLQTNLAFSREGLKIQASEALPQITEKRRNNSRMKKNTNN